MKTTNVGRDSVNHEGHEEHEGMNVSVAPLFLRVLRVLRGGIPLAGFGSGYAAAGILSIAAASLCAGQESTKPAPSNAAQATAVALVQPAHWVIPKTFGPDTTKSWPGNASVEQTLRAAEQGDPLAQCAVGDLYMKGAKGTNAVPEDHAKAVEWYQKSAEQGCAMAQFKLALKYSRGVGVAMDEAKAAAWFQKAVDQGKKEAARHLADMYASGRGPVMRNDAKAVGLYQRAIDLSGDTLSEFLLAKMVAQGLGVPKNEALALELYQDAANAGEGRSQCKLGEMHLSGNGLPKDLVRAYAWYSLACSSSEALTAKAAKQSKNDAEPKLTPEQKAEAAKLIEDLSTVIRKNKRPWHP